MRVKFTYKCTVCANENYMGKKNKTKHPEKQEIKKFCSKCNKSTLHLEKNKK